MFEEFKLRLSLVQLELLNNLNPIIIGEGDEKLLFGDKENKINHAIGRKSEEELNKIRI